METIPTEDNSAILEQAKLLKTAAYEKDPMGAHEKAYNKSQELVAKYGDICKEYDMYHLLIGSSERGRKYFDFPGEDSVEEFLKTL